MPSSLTWLDHSTAERERMQRILALFTERDTRDELGLGGVRDSLADQLFPGTSTIQTRLRYMLIVPWVYQSLEHEFVPSTQIASRARRFELSLIPRLLEGEEEGIFGRTAGGGLKRLPSTVYWAGLGTWGIRAFPGTQDQYHRSVDEVYRRRRAAHRRDDGEIEVDTGAVTWHPKLPPAPEAFPEQLDMRLTREEAEFLQERIVSAGPSSLLAFLVLDSRPTQVEAPWMHPDFARFRPEHQELLYHGRMFSEVMIGAAILYNILLSEVAEAGQREEEHRRRFERWAASLDPHLLRTWDLSRLWTLVHGHGYSIGYATHDFVQQWVALVRRSPHDLVEDSGARELIRAREVRLKGGRSRFRNRRALEQWGGYAGMTRMTYRWPNVQILLNDLFAGLGID